MTALDKDVMAANAIGLSYGYYKVLTYNPDNPPARKNRKHRKFDEQKAFSLWQQRMTDREIAEIVGVTKTTIQGWRGDLELPSSYVNTDRKKYRLTILRDGTTVALCGNDEL